MTKSTKVFSKFSTDSRKWNVGNGHEEKRVLSRMLSEQINAVFAKQFLEFTSKKKKLLKKFGFDFHQV